MGEPDSIRKAIAYARGDSGQHLADLAPRDRDIAELGVRRALFYLEREYGFNFEAAKKEAADGNG